MAEIQRHLCGRVGLSFEEFGLNTIKQNLIVALGHSDKITTELELHRDMIFTMYNTTFAGMDGRKVFKEIKKPQDLYKLPTDTKVIDVKIDPEAQRRAVERHKRVWQQRN